MWLMPSVSPQHLWLFYQLYEPAAVGTWDVLLPPSIPSCRSSSSPTPSQQSPRKPPKPLPGWVLLLSYPGLSAGWVLFLPLLFLSSPPLLLQGLSC